jgi:hypothetical protein
LRYELIELVDHPDYLMCGLDLKQGAIIHRPFLTRVPSFFNGDRDARRRLKDKCTYPTADLIRV